jgi:hypothetical protein
MWSLIEFILAIGELLMAWRFIVCILISFLLVRIVSLLFPDSAFSEWAWIPAILASLVAGFMWEVRADR